MKGKAFFPVVLPTRLRKFPIVANCTKTKPTVFTSFAQELALHAEGLAESGIYEGIHQTLVQIYNVRPVCVYEITDHGGYFSTKRIYTRDGHLQLYDALVRGESRWPTHVTEHHCDQCCRLAPGLAFLADMPDKCPGTILAHLAAACGDIADALNAMQKTPISCASTGWMYFWSGLIRTSS